MTFDMKKWREKMGKALYGNCSIHESEAAWYLGYSTSYIRKIESGAKPVPRLMPDACENILRKAKNKA